MMNNRKMFRVGVTGLMAFASLILASCDLDDDSHVQPGPVSYVSLYNASPDAPELEIVVDNRQINTYPLGYADNTGYLPFYTGNRNIKFGPYRADSIAVDTTITLVDQNAYSIFVVDRYADAEVLVFNDSSDAPGEGKAMVRFINLSPDASPVALKVKNETSPVTEDQSFKDASEFIEVDAKDYDFEIVSASDNEATLDLPDINLAAGSFHTIIVRGYRTPPGGNTHVISAEVITN